MDLTVNSYSPFETASPNTVNRVAGTVGRTCTHSSSSATRERSTWRKNSASPSTHHHHSRRFTTITLYAGRVYLPYEESRAIQLAPRLRSPRATLAVRDFLRFEVGRARNAMKKDAPRLLNLIEPESRPALWCCAY